MAYIFAVIYDQRIRDWNTEYSDDELYSEVLEFQENQLRLRSYARILHVSRIPQFLMFIRKSSVNLILSELSDKMLVNVHPKDFVSYSEHSGLYNRVFPVSRGSLGSDNVIEAERKFFNFKHQV